MTDSADLRAIAAMLRLGRAINPDDLEQIAIRVRRLERFADEVVADAAENETLLHAGAANVVTLRSPCWWNRRGTP